MPRMKGGLLLVVLLLVAVGVACAAGSGAAGGARSQSDPITITEIEQRGPFTNMYDMVMTLRPRWLRSQGPDSFVAGQGAVQVHIDGNWLGNVGTLRNLAAHGVTSVRWLGPVDAAARFGLDHGHGAIVVSTAPVH